MNYRIKQDEKYLGNDTWSWSAWIDAEPALLEKLDHVIWVLHPSFRPSRIERKDRSDNFRLDASGWGTFRLRAELHDVSGETHYVHCMLELAYPTGNDKPRSKEEPASLKADQNVRSAKPKPYVFMSYASEDARQAQVVRESMEKLGVNVRDAVEIEPDAPFEASVQKLIRESAGVMGLTNSDYVSPFVLEEMEIAKTENKPVLALLPKGVNRPAGLHDSIHEMRFDVQSENFEPVLKGFVDSLDSDIEILA